MISLIHFILIFVLLGIERIVLHIGQHFATELNLHIWFYFLIFYFETAQAGLELILNF